MNPYSNGYGSPYGAPNGPWQNPYLSQEYLEKKKIRSNSNFLGLALLGILGLNALMLLIYSAIYYLVLPNLLYGPNYNTVRQFAVWFQEGYSIFMYLVSFLLPFLVYMLAIKMPFRAALPMHKGRKSTFWLAIPIAMGVTVVSSFISSYLSMLLDRLGIGMSTPDISMPSNAVSVLLTILSSVILPCLIEEFAIRGVVMQSLRRFGDSFALVTSSILFAMLHSTLAQVPTAFLMGLCIGYFVLRTGNIWCGVAIHFCNNAFALILNFAIDHTQVQYQNMAILITYGVLLLVAVVSAVVYISRTPNAFRLAPSPIALTEGKKYQSFFVSAPMIVALVLLIMQIFSSLYWN